MAVYIPMTNGPCSICQKPLENPSTIQFHDEERPFHLFHDACIVEWLKTHKSCPVCIDAISQEKTNEIIKNHPSSLCSRVTKSCARHTRRFIATVVIIGSIGVLIYAAAEYS